MIAKLVNGNIIPCPLKGKDGVGRYHSNLEKYYESKPVLAMSEGYYPVEYTEKPEGNFISAWQLINNVIKQVWEPYTPAPEISIEKMRSDVDYIAMMTDVDLEGTL